MIIWPFTPSVANMKEEKANNNNNNNIFSEILQVKSRKDKIYVDEIERLIQKILISKISSPKAESTRYEIKRLERKANDDL